MLHISGLELARWAYHRAVWAVYEKQKRNIPVEKIEEFGLLFLRGEQRKTIISKTGIGQYGYGKYRGLFDDIDIQITAANLRLWELLEERKNGSGRLL